MGLPLFFVDLCRILQNADSLRKSRLSSFPAQVASTCSRLLPASPLPPPPSPSLSRSLSLSLSLFLMSPVRLRNFLL